MIVAFSTSSPQASVALIALGGQVLASGEVEAPMRASGACFDLLAALLKETGLTLENASLFAADRGPGSFTGVKVAVTVAKTLAFAKGKSVVGADSFDLISPDRVVVMPSKRGEFFVRTPGQAPVRTPVLPEGDYVGFGPGISTPVYPHAVRFAPLLGALVPIEPERMVPNYLIEPSISTPKSPLSAVPEKHG